MSIKIAINGFGRIGRNILRALYESSKHNDLEIVAINDLCDPQVNAHLTEYDSVHGRFRHSVRTDNNCLLINDSRIRVFSEKDPSSLPWRQLDIDIVFECTGLNTRKEHAYKHIASGAKRVLISAPSPDADATIVFGVNHDSLKSEHIIISNASCTTNCLAPMAKVIHEAYGIKSGLMTTVHAYTNDQHLTDAFSGDLYRARAAASSMIPTKTGAASAVGLVLPQLNGRLSGMAVRVPTANVSLVDLSFVPELACNENDINQLVLTASQNNYEGIIAYNDKPLVSVDFNHHSESCIFDGTQTLSTEGMIKVFAWYDNEWGFSNRMLDTALLIGRL